MIRVFALALLVLTPVARTPAFAEECVAPTATVQERLELPNRKCDSDKDCPGFANSCFEGHSTNP